MSTNETLVESVESVVEAQPFTPYTPEKSSSRTWLWIPGIALVLVLGAIGYWYWNAQQPVEVNTETVVSKDLSIEITGSGRVIADHPTDVYAKSPGLVSQVLVKDGQKVTIGEKLVVLDQEILHAQLTQAESGLAQAQSNLAQLSDGVYSRQAAMNAAYSGIDAASQGLDSAYQMQALADAGVSDAQNYLNWLHTAPDPSPEDVYMAEQALSQALIGQQQASAGVAQAQGSLAAANGSLVQAQAGDPASSIDAANALIRAAQEQVDLANQAIDEATITAPIAGTVVFAQTAASAQAQATGSGTPLAGASLMKGSAVTPGVPILTIVDSAHVLFEVDISEEDIGQVAPDQSVSILLDSDGSKQLKGTVTSIDEVAHNTLTGGTVFSVKIRIKAMDDAKVSVGMKGEATIQTTHLSGAMTISRKALFSEDGENFVYVVSDGQLSKKDVIVGDMTDEIAQIKSGLSVGETIALPENISFEDGLRVSEN